MADRLGAIDASFLYTESAVTPMHVGSVVLFRESPGGFDHERLVRLIRERLAFVPRYRQRVREVPGGLASPVWVDDSRFDVNYHVRRSALPAPGSMDQLVELVARIMSRPLDRRHPLWEVYLVEGIEGHRFALLTKTHQAMVDGLTAVDIAEVILDDSVQAQRTPPMTWKPPTEPSGAEILASAIGESLARPGPFLRRIGASVSGAARVVGDVAGAFIDAARPEDGLPLNVSVGAQRRFAAMELSLADLKAVRGVTGGSVTDVTLAVVAGALRSWLYSRGVPIAGDSVVRTIVPVSLAADDPRASRVSALVLDLPVGEADPVIRVQRIAYETARHGAESRIIGARALVELVGFAPATLHALGARFGSSLSKRSYSLIVTNVPGPQTARFVGGAQMLAAYPVIPLGPRQAMSIGMTSYDGQVFLGINADRDGMPDLGVVVASVRDSMAELLDATRPEGRRRLRVARGKAT